MLLSDMQPWREHSACRGVDVNVFYPDESPKADYRPAKQICADCPVATECLAYAMSGEHGMHGCWGGTTPRERKILRRRAGLGASVAVIDITYQPDLFA